ncbi:hypothetical protein J4H86_22325 [Spiractinospora alimapuensis]|uniref:DUF6086 family protein n=1 Tax=Spiractinospora alimapuensis TaxID=2820884 RepID=UPI001F409318|nr:DUF6086 family protein [Spiractinospora alimapuensis]QVQ51502.1 hypothetical protein J4H86_22325 [Spiractinospora alimapuensis]
MSVFFDVDGQSVWNPSNTVAEVYLATAAALRGLAGTETGLGERRDDECAVDAHQLRDFTTALLRRRGQAPTTPCCTRCWTGSSPRPSYWWSEAVFRRIPSPPQRWTSRSGVP